MTTDQANHTPVLAVEGLKKYFPIRRGLLQRTTGWVKAVEDVSFEIAGGQTLGLVGESGCGKTTVARLILKLLDADAGHILFKQQDIIRLNDRQMSRLRKEIQMVFQDPYGSLNPRMTVAQTLAEGLTFAGYNGQRSRNDRLSELVETVGLSESVLDRYPHEFSGGQRQRIGIARALSVEPSLIICDEPISALDVSIQAQIINLLKDLQDRLHLSYLFISHDLNVVGYISNYVAVMFKGQIMEYGPSEAIFDSPGHPYTHVLLSAVPDPDAPGKILSQMPETGQLEGEPAQEGCLFKDQCQWKEPECSQERIGMLRIGTEHYIRCRKPDPKNS